MRLFFAIMLPPDVQAGLHRLRERLDWLPIRPTWTAQQNLHITLKFLGEVPDPQVADLARDVAQSIHLARPLHLRPDHLVFFPSRGPARVLGIGFSGDTDPLYRFQSDLEAFCRTRGFPTENRPYTPHATLARIRDGLREQHRPRIEQSWQSLSHLPEFEASAYQLMQSILGSRGSTHTPVVTVPAGRA